MRLFDFVVGLFRVGRSQSQELEDVGRAVAAQFWQGFRAETESQMRELAVDLTGTVPEQLQIAAETNGNGEAIDYTTWKRPQLIKEASGRGIEGAFQMRKADLVEALMM